jgi:hypothetical protein
MTPASAVAQSSEIHRKIAKVTSVPEAKLLRDQAEAILKLVRSQHSGLEEQNAVAEVKIRCERQLGALLAKTVRHEGGRPNGNGSLPFRGLPEGVSKMQSSRWQAVARVPEHVFETWMAKTREEEGELTTAGLTALAPPMPDPAPDDNDGDDDNDNDGDDDDDDEGDDDNGGDDDDNDELNKQTRRVVLKFNLVSLTEFQRLFRQFTKDYGTATQGATALAAFRDLARRKGTI